MNVHFFDANPLIKPLYAFLLFIYFLFYYFQCKDKIANACEN